MIARLSVLVQRTSERVPSPKEFLFWQVNETTEAMESTFKALVNHSGRVKSPAMWADQDFLKKRMEDLYKQLIKLLGVEWLPLFNDEANVFARPLCKPDHVIVTANGTIRSDGLLSLILQSVSEGAPWSRAPIIITGTGFTTEVSNIIQSSGFWEESKTTPDNVSNSLAIFGRAAGGFDEEPRAL